MKRAKAYSLRPGFQRADLRERQLDILIYTYPHRLIVPLLELDWLGLDIKTPPDKYDEITLVFGSAAPAYQGAKAILESSIAYEFRTTIHPALLSDDDITEIVEELTRMGAQHFVLQRFREIGCGDALLRQPISPNYPSSETVVELTSSFPYFLVRHH